MGNNDWMIGNINPLDGVFNLTEEELNQMIDKLPKETSWLPRTKWRTTTTDNTRAIPDAYANPVSKTELEDFKQMMLEQIEDMQIDQDNRLSAIEDQIAIVRRDACTEEEFEELRKAWEHYNETLEKLKTFKALKDSA